MVFQKPISLFQKAIIIHLILTFAPSSVYGEIFGGIHNDVNITTVGPAVRRLPKGLLLSDSEGLRKPFSSDHVAYSFITADATETAVVPTTNGQSMIDLPLTDDDFEIKEGSPLPEHLVRRLLEVTESSQGRRMQTADLYGGIYNFAYYFMSIQVGTPAQRQSVIVDSGSSLLGFPCSDCVVCGRTHMDRGFNIAASSSARWLSCSSPSCYSNKCGNRGACHYHQSYSEGSSIEGNYFSDLVALGDRRNEPVRFDFIGCHSRETNLFTTQRASGILGISYPKRGKQQTLIDAIFDSPVVDSKVFAICGAEEGGSFTIGGYNGTLHRPSETKGASNLRLLSVAQALRHDASLRKLLEFDEAAKLRHSKHKVNGRRLLRDTEFESMEEPHDYLRALYHLLKETTNETRPNGRRLEGSFLGRFHKARDNYSKTIPLDPTNGAPEIAWTPITSTSTYEIDVSEIRARESKTDSQEPTLIAQKADLGQCIVDSGTTFSYLATRAFRAVMNVLDRSCASATASFCVSRATSSPDQLCWRLQGEDAYKQLPIFLLRLGSGAIVEWNALGYLHRRARTSIWCVALDDNHGSSTVLGMSFMKNKDVIFDRERDLLGFVEADCPITDAANRDKLLEQNAAEFTNTSIPDTPSNVEETMSGVAIDVQTLAQSQTTAPSSTNVSEALFGVAADNVDAVGVFISDIGDARLPPIVPTATSNKDVLWTVSVPTGFGGATSLLYNSPAEILTAPSPPSNFKPVVMWASAGVFMTASVVSMAAITARAINRRRLDYSAMPPSADIEIGSYRDSPVDSSRSNRNELGPISEDDDFLEREIAELEEAAARRHGVI